MIRLIYTKPYISVNMYQKSIRIVFRTDSSLHVLNPNFYSRSFTPSCEVTYFHDGCTSVYKFSLPEYNYRVKGKGKR